MRIAIGQITPAKPRIDPMVWRPPTPTRRAAQSTSERRFDFAVYPMPGRGPEDVAIDDAGDVYTGLVDGRILRVSADGRRIAEVANTGGRPLGIEIDEDAALVVCDARLGLLNVDPRTGRVRTLVDRIDGKPLLFCNNGALGSDGSVYFTDSSTRFGIDHYKGELMAHTGTGRLFRRDPDGAVDLILDGLQFANGVALTADESAVIVAETGGYDLVRLWLTGARQGRRDEYVANLPGFPDNISLGSDGLIWVALPSPRDRMLDALLPRPPMLRRIVWSLPDRLQPQERRTAWVQAYDADGRLVHDLQATDDRFHTLTGVRERAGVVWLGSLTAPALASYQLPRH